MKILEVIHDFLPRHTAGSEVYTFKLSKEFQKRGHEVCLFFTESDRSAEQYTLREYTFEGLPCFEAVVNRHYSDFTETYLNPAMEKVFREVLEKTRPEIIHLQHLINHSLSYARMAKERGIPVVFTLHDYWLTCPLGGQRIRPDLTICHELDPARCCRCISRYSKSSFRLKRLFNKVSGRLNNGAGGGPQGTGSPGRSLAARSFLRFNGLFEGMASKKLVPEIEKRTRRVLEAAEYVDLFIAPSRFLRDRFIEFGLPEEKILYSDYGFDVEAFREAAKRDVDGKVRAKNPGGGKKTGKKDRGAVRFGYTGSLVPHKGVHVLVEAFSGIEHGRAELRIYGDLTWFPDYVARLRAGAEGTDIRFMGAFENSQAPGVLAGMDVLVVPSVWFENSPLTIHEAFIAGIPVITSNLGGMAELVEDGVSGLVFETGNAEDLKEKMEAVINEPGLLERLRKGLPEVKTIGEDASQMEEIFRGLVSSEDRVLKAGGHG